MRPSPPYPAASWLSRLKAVHMIIKSYIQLPPEAKTIRTAVFVSEQGFAEEFDDIDETAVHLVMYVQEQPVATCRVYFNPTKQSFVVGRIAVLKPWRGKQLGAAILRAAEERIRQDGGKQVMLAAQVTASAFYKKQGYCKHGEPFMEEHCPHIWMIKQFQC